MSELVLNVLMITIPLIGVTYFGVALIKEQYHRSVTRFLLNKAKKFNKEVIKPWIEYFTPNIKSAKSVLYIPMPQYTKETSIAPTIPIPGDVWQSNNGVLYEVIGYYFDWKSSKWSEKLPYYKKVKKIGAFNTLLLKNRYTPTNCYQIVPTAMATSTFKLHHRDWGKYASYKIKYIEKYIASWFEDNPKTWIKAEELSNLINSQYLMITEKMVLDVLVKFIANKTCQCYEIDNKYFASMKAKPKDEVYKVD